MYRWFVAAFNGSLWNISTHTDHVLDGCIVQTDVKIECILHGLCSFSKHSVTSPTSHLILILQAFSHFTYITAHSDSPSFLSLHLHHNSFWFSKLSVTSPTSQLILILQAFCHFTYITAHSDSPSFQSLHLHHSSFWFSKLSVTSPTSQLILILQASCHFTYVTAHSPTLPSLYLCHNSLSSPSVASPTSQLILQPFFCFSYVTRFSLTSPGKPPMISKMDNKQNLNKGN